MYYALAILLGVVVAVVVSSKTLPETFDNTSRVLTMSTTTGNLQSNDPTLNMFYCDGSTSCTQPYAAKSLLVGTWTISYDSSGDLTLTSSGTSTSVDITGSLNCSGTSDSSFNGWVDFIGNVGKTSSYPSTTYGGSDAGGSIAWNASNGSGEMSFMNNYSSSSGGFGFIQRTGTSSASWLASFTANNTLESGSCTGYANFGTVITNGYIGIGTTSPISPLHVQSNMGADMPYSYSSKYIDSNTTSIGSYSSNAVTNFSIYTPGRIYANSIFLSATTQTSSDVRIKKEITDIHGGTALSVICNIRPRMYKYIDDVAYGEKLVYGFIAQEVQKVLPVAVEKIKEFVPNCFKVVTVKDGIIHENLDCDINTKIKLYDSEKEHIVTVTEKFSNGFVVVDGKLDDNRYFCYGTEVGDFQTIDKNSIFTVAVSAIQELNKQSTKQDKLVTKLEKENKSLKLQLSRINKKLRTIESRMKKIC